MMTPKQGNLLLLLRLMEGRLPETEAAEARKLLADPAVQSRWRRLHQADRHSPLADNDLSDLDRLSPEEAAAFVEERLSREEAARFESTCWQSLAALGEVISTFRFVSSSNPPQAVTAALTGKLLASVAAVERTDPVLRSAAPPAHNTGNANPINGHRSRMAGAGTESSPTGERSAQAAAVQRRPARHKARREASDWWIYIATAAAVLLCLGALALLRRESNDNRAARPDRQKHIDRQQREPLEPQRRFVDRNDPVVPRPPRQRGRDPEDPPRVETDEESIATDWKEARKELNISDTARMPLDPLAPEPQEQSPKLVERPQPADQPIKVQWDRIEGVVAAWDGDSGKWHGVNYQVGRIDSTFATLPQSWASASATTYGRMVLGSDTEISLGTSTEDPATLDLTVTRGRVALHDLPPENAVAVAMGKARWSVRATRPESIVGVDLTTSRPRLLVPRGEVDVDGMLVHANQQVFWNGDRWETTQPVALRENTNWTERPVGAARLSSAVKTQLLASNDLRQDLVQVKGIDKRLATRWLLAVAPGDIFERLNSPDTNIRSETIRWLLSLHPRDRRITTAFRQLAAASGNPQLVRSMFNWIQAMRQNREAKASDAQQLVRGLEHRELALRHLSAYLLETAFPARRNSFKPQATPQQRRAAAQQWRRFLQAQMRAVSQPSSVPRAATGNRGATQRRQPANRVQRRPASNRRN